MTFDLKRRLDDLVNDALKEKKFIQELPLKRYRRDENRIV